MSVDNVWDNSDADNDGNNPNNWSQNRVPTTGDIAVFDSASTSGNCTLTGNISCDGIRFDNAFAGIFDAATFDVTVGSGGHDFTNAGSATVDMGSGTWTNNSGNVVNLNSIGTFTRGTATWVLAGTMSFPAANYNHLIYGLKITGTVTFGANTYCFGPLEIAGGGNAIVNGILGLNYATELIVDGTVSGAGTLSLANKTLTSFGGQITVASFVVGTYAVGVIPAGVYDAGTTTIKIIGPISTFTPSSVGLLKFTGNLLVQTSSGTLTINMATRNNDLECQGNFTLSPGSGTINWTKGTGTITFSGSNAQAVDLLDKAVENIVINKDAVANTVTFNGGFVTDSFTLTQGTIAFANGAFTLSCDDAGAEGDDTGDFTITANGQVNPAELMGKTIIVDGDCSFTGELGDLLNLVALNTWHLDVAGTATATYVDVDYSDASLGVEVDASDGTNTDSGHNTNWNFGAAGFARSKVYSSLAHGRRSLVA